MTQPMNKNSIRTIQNCIATRTDFHETTPECDRQKISLDMMGRMLREFPVESYEQGAPSNVLNYKCYSYEKARNPFQLLRNHYNGNDGLLSQYYAQLVQQGMLKGASQQDIEKCFRMYGGEELNQALDQADSIAQYLSMIEKQQDDQHIHVCPIMCGAGKSQAISKLIVDHAMNDTGMIVVTDNKQRMMDYINGVNNPTVRSMMDLCVIMGKITILNEDTRAEVASEQVKSPVLIITTQHYFKIGLGGVQHYLSWNGGRREVIIIDEAPYINRTVQIDRGSFNNVLTMLENGAGGDQVTATEKQWCIHQWKALTDRIKAVMEQYEQSSAGGATIHRFYKDANPYLTEDDGRFFRYLRNSCAYTINNIGQGNESTAINDIRYLIKHGGIYAYTGTKERYQSYFCVTINSRDILTNLGSPVIVLDGTADIHPDYKDESLVIKYDFSCFNRSLEGLTIRFVDFASGRVTLNSMPDQINVILDYLEETLHARSGDIKNSAVVFSYKDQMSRIMNRGYQNVGYFGNLKGSNTMRDKETFVQIGLNRFPPLYYLSYTLARDKKQRNALMSMTDDESEVAIASYLANINNCQDVMLPFVFADLEQNMFRGCIRKNTFIGQMSYTVVCSVNSNRKLIELVKSRYELLGAKVEVVETPLSSLFRRISCRSNGEHAKKILAFINSLNKGTNFTKDDMVKATGLTKKEINKVISRGSLTIIMSRFKTTDDPKDYTWTKKV